MQCVTMPAVKPKVLAPGMYAIDVEPFPPRNRKNREVHLDYLKHLKESVETLCKIVEEARIEKPLDNTLENACFYTKRSQDLVNNSTKASGSKPKSNTKNNRILPAKSDNKKKVEAYPRNNKSKLKQENHVDSSTSSKHCPLVFRLRLLKTYDGESLTAQEFHEKNIVVKRRNCTLVEVARTMLIFYKALMFLWAEDVATAALCYPTNDSEDLGKLKAKANIGIFVGYAPNRKGPVPHTPAVYVPVISTGTPSSTTIDQDASSLSHSPSSSEVQPPISHQGVAAGPTFEDNPFAQAEDDPFVNVFALEPSSEASSSGDVSSAESNQVIQPHNHLGKWSKDHPMDNVIIKPKNFKTAMAEACWFKAMQEEIHKFDRLQVWELVPKLDYVMIIALKWIYKVKLDEYGNVLKNKARLVAKGYRQEEGIDLRNHLHQLHR
ncbi:retrovirus-related pol polyprotein from transposon TNT 1-94 [Tanacetum coccineum]